MDFSQFHFAQSGWLWGLLAVPAVLAAYAGYYAKPGSLDYLERFADRHLLPHLLKARGVQARNIGGLLWLWALAWTFGMLAMAGPRWNYANEETFKVTQGLVIVLDLSQSMNVTDVKPSRIARARQELEDLLIASRGASVGLVAYAAVPHMVTPLTDDIRTIGNLLPALDTSLVTLQGDKLEPALEMAARMLQGQPGTSKAIVVISDGDFEDTDYAKLAAAAGGNPVYALGIGSVAGAPLAGSDGDWLKDGAGRIRLFRLQSDRLQRLAGAANGAYVQADYGDGDTKAILNRIGIEEEKAGGDDGTIRVWGERFYIPALALALLLLPLFRRGVAFPLVLLAVTAISSPGHAQVANMSDIFLNPEQQAGAAFQRGDYKDAMARFNAPYRRGVAAYRAGSYEEAASAFAAAAAQNTNLDALYNLGNAQLMQNDPQDAISSYEAVLKQRPNDASAKHNLEIARKILAQNKQKQDSPDKQPNKQQKDQPDSKGGGGGKSGGGGNNNQNAQDNKDKQDQKPPQKDADNSKGNQKGQGGQNQPPPKGPQNQQQANQPNQPKEQQKPPQPQQPPQQQNAQKQPQQQQPPPQQQAQRQPQPQGGSGQQQPPQQAQAQRGGQPQPVAPGAPPAGQAGTPQDAYALAKGPLAKGPSGPALPQDASANPWLGRLQSDPATLLRNQFMIEDLASSVQRGKAP